MTSKTLRAAGQTLLGLGVFLLLGTLLVAGTLTAAAAPAASVPTATPALPTAEPTNTPPIVQPSPTATRPPAQPSPTATRPPPAPTEPTAPTDPPPPDDTPRRPPPSPTPSPTLTPEPSPSPAPELPPVDIGVEKTSSVSQARIGDTVVFTVRIFSRGGAETVNDVVMTDIVPDAFAVTNLASTKGDIVVEGQTVHAFPRTLAAGEEVIITITTVVREGTPPGTVTNTATVTSTGCPPGTNTACEPDSSSVPVEILPPPAVPPAAPPAAPAGPPPSLPDTSDPLVDQEVMLVYLPWATVAVLMIAMGMLLVRRGNDGTPALATVGARTKSSTARRAPALLVAPATVERPASALPAVAAPSPAAPAAPAVPAPEQRIAAASVPELGPDLPEPARLTPLPPRRGRASRRRV